MSDIATGAREMRSDIYERVSAGRATRKGKQESAARQATELGRRLSKSPVYYSYRRSDWLGVLYSSHIDVRRWA